MDTQIQRSRSDLTMCNVQIQRLEREAKLAELTEKELENSQNSHVWEGVGKMFKQTTNKEYCAQLKKDKNTVGSAIKDLEKKKNYLEVTLETFLNNMNQILAPHEK